MENFILLILCLGIGLALKRVAAFPKEAHLGLNGFIIYISLPAIALSRIPELSLSWLMLLPFSTGIVIFLFAILFFKALNRYFLFDKNTLGCLILSCGLGNTSFVGFPVVTALFGNEGLSVAIFVDQGSFLALAIGGISVAMLFSEGKVSFSVISKRLIYFPPFLAFLLALLLMPFGGFPSIFKEVLEKLGSLLTPLALVSVGLQLNLSEKFVQWRSLTIGLFFKLMLAPALIYGLFVVLLGQTNLSANVSVIEAAMAPMVTASILATQYKLNPPLANLLVGIGIPLSLMTVFIWWAILQLV